MKNVFASLLTLTSFALLSIPNTTWAASENQSQEALNTLQALVHPGVTALLRSIDKVKLIPHEMIDGPEIQEFLKKQSSAKFIKTHLLDSDGGDTLVRQVSSECEGPRSKQKCTVTVFENYLNSATQENQGESAHIFEFELNAGKIKNNIVKLNIAG